MKNIVKRLEGKKITTENLMSVMTLEEKLGQMFMLDFRRWKNKDDKEQSDHQVFSPEVKELIGKYGLGNVILFAENFADIDQIVKFNHELKNSVVNGIPMIIGVDQEGGRVVRMNDGCSMPGNMCVGATDDAENAYKNGYIIGKELKAVGINCDFAPSIDVNNNPANPVINLRSFSSSHTYASPYGVKMAQGLQDAGVAATGKHFPGHGDTNVDSHTGLPVVNKTLEQLMEAELIPFIETSKSGIYMYMTAHMTFPLIAKERYVSKQTGKEMTAPATLSKTFLTDILRDKLGYEGVVITDSMQMQAISTHMGSHPSLIKAINAGVDILLMFITLRNLEDEYKLADVFTALTAAVKTGELSMDRINESTKRVLDLKIKMGLFDEEEKSLEEKLEYAKAVVGCKEHREIERQITADGITVLENNGVLPLDLSDNKKVLYVSAYSNKTTSFEYAVKRLVSEGKIKKFEYDTYTYNGKSAITDELKEKVDKTDYVIVVTETEAPVAFDKPYVSFPVSLCKYCKETGKKVVVISSFLPYDAPVYKDADALLLCYCPKGMSKEAASDLNTNKAYGVNVVVAVECVLGGMTPGGKLPVDIFEVKPDGSYNFDKIEYPFGYSKK
ncbi:MAG: glycoside hydrolase family 3 protein [Ruminococcaceae bacterium]|nr:glycoside hydrolase family 3 protein [Oscillospiraceae bacterium]